MNDNNISEINFNEELEDGSIDQNQMESNRARTRDLLSRLMTVIVTLALIVVLALAWFTIVRRVNSGAELGAVDVDGPISYTLYKLTPSSDVTSDAASGTVSNFSVDSEAQQYYWRTVNNVEFNLMEPNEVCRYKLKLNSGSISKLRFDITTTSFPPSEAVSVTSGTAPESASSVTSAVTSQSQFDGAFEIFDYFYFRDSTEAQSLRSAYSDNTIVGFAARASSAGNGEITNRQLKWVVFNCTTPGSGEYVFDIYLHKDACNLFESVSITGTLTPVK